jgi:putative ABC transport system permease protein
MDGPLSDLVIAWRRLSRAPVFALFAIATLAVGIGATTAMWSIVRLVMAPPSGVRESETIVNINHAPRGGFPLVRMSWPDYQDLRRSQTAFETVSAWSFFRQAVAANGRMDSAFGEIVGGEYFDLLGVRAVVGRTLQPADDVAGAPPVAVLSYSIWQRMFDGTADIVGRPITVNGHAFEIVGVADGSFHGLFNNGFVPTAVWVPLASAATLGEAGTGFSLDPNNRERRWLSVKGRLKPGRTLDDAQAELMLIAKRLDMAYPIGRERDARTRSPFVTSRQWTAQPLDRVILGENVDFVMRPLIGAFMAAVGLVLLIACTNITNLMLARVAGRQQETAVRLALGASRWRLIRETLGETVILASAGGSLGLLLTRLLTRMLGGQVNVGGGVILTGQPPFDVTVFVGGAVTTLLALMVAGVGPALQAARVNPRSAFATDGNGTATPRWHGRRLLIAVQVAVSLLLLALASLCVAEVQSEHQHDSGVVLKELAVLVIDFPVQRVDELRARRILDYALSTLARHPGVEAVAASSGLPFGLATPGGSMMPTEGGAKTQVEFVAATPAIHRVLGVAVVRGRSLDSRDDAVAPRVAVISERTAMSVFGRTDVVGHQAILKRAHWVGEPEPPATEVTIVGVAADTDTGWLGRRDHGVVYIPLAQQYEGRLVLSARNPTDPATTATVLRKMVTSVGPDIAVSQVGVASAVIGPQNPFLEVVAGLAGVLGIFALLVALAGLYGALSHIVGRRTREIGVRLALGADAREIVRMVVLEGLGPVALGISVGLIVGAIARSAMQPILVQVLPKMDSLLLIVAPISMLVAASFACYFPARRAARLDPNVALKDL